MESLSRTPVFRVVALSLVIIASCVSLAVVLPAGALLHRHLELLVPLLVTTLLFDRIEMNAIIGRQLLIYCPNNLPLGLALCVLGLPSALVLVTLADVVNLRVMGRRPWFKVVGNLAVHQLEVLVLWAVLAHLPLAGSWSWGVIGLAFLLSNLAGVLGVGGMIAAMTGIYPPLSTRVRSIAATSPLFVIEALATGVALALLDEPVDLAVFAVLGGLALWGYGTYDRQRQRQEQLSLLVSFTEAVGDRVETADVVRVAVEKVAEVLRSDVAWVVLPGVGDGVGDGVGWTLRVGQGLTPMSAADAETLLALVDAGPALVPRATDTDLASLGVQHLLAAPLPSHAGVLAAGERGGGALEFTESELGLLVSLAATATVALDKSRLLDEVRREAAQREADALRDTLTGLPGRALVTRTLDQALDAGEVGVVLLGLDRFQDVNESVGHDLGDQLLRLYADRLVQAVPAGALVGRISGDGFVVVLPGASLEHAETTAHGLRAVLAEPVRLGGPHVEVTATAAVTARAHGQVAGRLLMQAELALREAKRRGLAVLVHDAAAAERSTRRLALATELRVAVETDQLSVVFQPKVGLSSGDAYGVEALVRWSSETYGPVGPDEFVPLAEQLGLVSDLTRFVLDQALALAASSALSVAVNVSPRGLADGSLVQDVVDGLARHAVAAGRLTLELTEGTIMSDAAVGVDILNQLADMGVQLSIDDFGTGYSSLAYLQKLPVQELKIDRSFVMAMAANLGDAVIVRSTVRLAHELGLSVVAEGVEDAESWHLLRDLGCDSAQGWFQARPMPASELPAWLAAWPAKIAPELDSCFEILPSLL